MDRSEFSPKSAGDVTLRVLFDPYRAFAAVRADLRTDHFWMRLLGRPGLVLCSVDAAQLIYRPGAFPRTGALPATTLRLLQGRGSGQTLEGDAHRARKALLMGALSATSTARLVRRFEEAFAARIPRWRENGEVHLQREAEAALCEAALAWAGLALTAPDRQARLQEFRAMVNHAGTFDIDTGIALALRARCEAFAQAAVERLRREGSDTTGDATPAQLVAALPGPARVAGRELINLLRPIVAVGRYIAFCGHALGKHPALRAGLAERPFTEAFVDEVRRFYPFFPFIAGVAAAATPYRDGTIPAKTWTIVDLYGLNHDPRFWTHPERFDPERFLGRTEPPLALAPQGAGDPWTGHRCAGEAATVALMATAAETLAALPYRLVGSARVAMDRAPARVTGGPKLATV